MALKGIDRITGCVPAKRITTGRTYRLEEEYFRDHFPGFPVVPGVMMLEGLVQSASWLIHETEGYLRSQAYLVRLNQARYSRLVRPETTLEFEVDIVGQAGEEYECKGRVMEKGQSVAKAQFTMRSGALGELSPDHAALDPMICEKRKAAFRELSGKGV